MKIRQARKSLQQGVMLIEALVAILLFSLGVVAVMGMQAVSIEQVSQAKYRTDASYLANQIIGQMWVDLPHLTNYGTAGDAVRTGWDAVVASTLPQGTGTITVSGTVVTVTINWQTPNDSTVRKFTSIVTLNPSS
ncbi:MAG TPA: prepilin-type cleavage/methylation domain-containing protein [Usitatibacter sp.]|jgi:type IV pilus assembly protein PilV